MVLTLVLVAIALPVSCLLPMPQQSMFFHRRLSRQQIATEGTMRNVDGTTEHTGRARVSLETARDEKVAKGETEDEARPGLDEKGPPSEDPEESVGTERCSKVLLQLWRDFRQCYSSRQMLYWSVWWAMATCSYNQTANYIQVLYLHVQPAENMSVYNGGVEAISNLFGAATAYGIGFSEVRWDKWGELALGGFSGLEAGALFLMTFAGNIWVCYTGYVIFKSLHMMLITLAMYQIATDLSMERYALVFGVNTFGALVLQTIMTSIVVDSGGLGLDIIDQFTINASYVSIIAVVYSLRGMFTLWRLQRSNKSHETTAPLKEEPPDSDAQITEHKF